MGLEATGGRDRGRQEEVHASDSRGAWLYQSDSRVSADIWILQTLFREASAVKELQRLTADCSGRDELENLLTSKRVGAYCGVDPTASSLHVGHIVPFMVLFWMYLHGFQAVTLLGGGTVKLGDPTGRTTARSKLENRERKTNIALMHIQLKSIWAHVETLGSKHGYKRDKTWKRALLNNSVWLNKLPAIDIFSELGPAFRMGALMSRDSWASPFVIAGCGSMLTMPSVKTRMESGDGMSFAEFSYPIVQAWDWWHMYSSIGVQLQIGGADQYGNIISGIDGVKHMAKNHPHQDIRVPDEAEDWEPMGLTVPLLTTSSGEKFGKSAGNAVWLSQEMTSAFDLYAVRSLARHYGSVH
jgi:tyrosyl-tRNA synthetase